VIYLLAASLLVFVISGIFEMELRFVLSLVTAVTALAGLRCPRMALAVFWVWVVAVLTVLLYLPVGDRALLGFPVPAFCMLVGIWIVPVFIWPLAFTRGFKRWVDKP
jgi:hypothetical protein